MCLLNVWFKHMKTYTASIAQNYSMKLSQLFRFNSRLLRISRRCRYAVCIVLAIALLLVIRGSVTNLDEPQYKVEHPTAKVWPTAERNTLYPLDRPLIGIKDLNLTKNSKFCKQYFQEGSRENRVIQNVFNASNPDPVCLITHFTPSRSDMFQSLLYFWKGTISASLYIENRDYVAVMNTLGAMLREGDRNNVFIHVVLKDGEFYPINYLRNVAMRSERGCFYQFLSDIDFMPSPDLNTVLFSYLLQGVFSPFKNLVLVVPAFSMLPTAQNNTDIRETFPKTKQELISLWNQHKLEQFHPKGNGHRVTNYTKWRNSSQPYMIDYEEGYEPYILIPKARAPFFINLFLQRYGNKVSYFVELNARGFEFLVIPNGFVVHLPHPSQDTKKLFSKIGGCSLKVFKTLKSQLKALKKMEQKPENGTENVSKQFVKNDLKPSMK